MLGACGEAGASLDFAIELKASHPIPITRPNTRPPSEKTL
jgi:hypothetical protein